MTAPRTLHVAVPASTANLGPGFDTFGMALGRYDEVDVVAAPGQDAPVRVEVSGEGAGAVATGERHLVAHALLSTAAELGLDLPPLLLLCRNTIPHSRGLGSSASAIVAGVAAAYGLAGRDVHDDADAQRALELAARLEGHPDNVAASLYGGMVLAWQDGGRYRAARLPVHPDIAPVVLIPESGCSTELARGLLPESVPHTDAVHNAARAALAVRAVTAEPALLFAATEDRLHQDYRERAYPESMRAVRELRARGVAAAISGAGPCVVALTTGGALPAGFDAGPFHVTPVPVDTNGVRVGRAGG